MAKKRTEAEVTFIANDDGLKSTLKEINAELTKNRAELKLEQAQLQLTGSESDKLGSKLSSLEKQYELQSQKVEVTSQRLANAKKYYGENSIEVQKLERELINQQTAQQRLSNELDKTSNALAQAKGEIQTYESTMQQLDSEQKNVQASASLIESEYKKWQATAGRSASESEKLAKAQEYVSQQSENAEKTIDILRRQLEATQSEFGVTSTEAMQMEAKLNDAEREFEELGQAAKDVDTTSLDDIGSKIDMNNLMEASDVLSDIGDKLTELGKQAVDSANSVGSSQSKIQANFGLTKQEAAELTNVAKDIYYKGFGESLDQSTDALILVKRNLGDLNNQDLQNITEQAMVLENTMGADMDETLRGVNGLMVNFGLSAQDAMDLMVSGTQNGLDKTHELGDNMAEYSQLWSQMGYSADETFGMLQNGLDAGAYNLDKVNDLVKEMGISLTDGRFEQNMDMFSESTRKAFEEWKNGGGTQKDVINSMIQDFSNMDGQYDQLNKASTIWSALGEDNAMKVVQSLTDVNHTFDDVSGSAQKMNEDSTTPLQELNGKIAELKDSLAPIGNTIIEALEPVIDFLGKMADTFNNLPQPVQDYAVVIGGLTAAFTLLMPIIVGFMALGGPTTLIIGAVITAIAGVIAIVKNWGAITDWFKGIWSNFTGWLGDTWESLKEGASSVWDGVKETWSGFVDWVSNIWNGVKEVWSIIWADIVGIVQIPWTLITSLIQAGINIIVGIFDVAGQLLGVAWQAVWTPISDFLKNTWDTMTQWISIAWNGIVTTFHTIFDPVVAWWNGIWTSISTTASNIWNSISSTASNTWNSVTSNISNAINTAKSAIQSVWNSISSWISGIWNGIKNTALNLWNGITSTISSKVNDGKNAISSGWSNLTSIVSGIFNNVKNTISNIWEGIKKTVSAPIDWIRDKISNLFDNLNISIPHIPLPHFKLSGEFNLLKGKIPTLDVDWYAKGSVFNSPNIIGVGEAGPEAVLPLKRSVLQEIGDRILSSTSVSSRAQTVQPVNNYEFNFTIDGNADEVTMKQTTQQIIDSITKIQNDNTSAWR
ncbi:phage tail tape measure protein [Enterococcus durans]|uniref:Phage tail tape measure protein n=1 Tax=Enterococcus durans TaxID=53345 RepID=A0A5N0YM72_9ENTE|nr:phage tail tape measure protein [Enterococcus durans]KAA9183918.1 phage tail tape measure protein [Enterococcus durans]KAA9185203.1 phage tail tape measure protein [Enterococcus durans]KAA9188250.1 phage tail tape measure protein [Enterococcus durans]KAA9190290.1 phage tail tape measure protein [Enterococcus durans]KAA9190532.1 phage tail tape measure protein [Enterococcus durans]